MSEEHYAPFSKDLRRLFQVPDNHSLAEWALDGSDIMVSILDSDYNLLYASEAYLQATRRLFGLAVCPGQNLKDWLGAFPVQLAKSIQVVDKALSGQIVHLQETYGMLKSERLDVLAYPLRDHEGVIRAVLRLFLPMPPEETLRERLYEHERELEEQAELLAESNEQLQQFAHIASHDLQEPLRVVGSYLKLLQKELGDISPKAQHYMSRALEGADRMKGLIHGLLEFSRVGSHAGSFATFPLAECLQDALDDLEVALREAQAEVHFADDLPHIHADRLQVTQIFANLLSNALKYRREDAPRITIEAHEHPEHWQITITDNGLGVVEQERERIFEVFQRLHSVDKIPGSGIGLAVCRRIARRHGGRIWVESHDGPGSRFVFTLAKHLTEPALTRPPIPI